MFYVYGKWHCGVYAYIDACGHHRLEIVEYLSDLTIQCGFCTLNPMDLVFGWHLLHCTEIIHVLCAENVQW